MAPWFLKCVDSLGDILSLCIVEEGGGGRVVELLGVGGGNREGIAVVRLL